MISWLTSSFFWSKWTILITGFSLIDIERDRKPILWRHFLPLGLLMFWIVFTMYQKRAYPWYHLTRLYFPNEYLRYQWANVFRHIPFNNGWPFRIFHTPFLDFYFRFVYRAAFFLNLWVCVFRGFFARDSRKMFHYMIGAFIIQMVIIMPFYYFVNLNEVWYTLGDPDHLQRHLHGIALFRTIGDCFPSMHTSCAVGVLLLALREKSPVFRWTMVTYCASVVYATLYLEVHWLLDVVAGIALAYVAVKVSDVIVHGLWDVWPERIVALGQKLFVHSVSSPTSNIKKS